MFDKIQNEILEIISQIIEVPKEKLKAESDLFKDLGVDSLKAIEIVATIEKKYKIQIPEEEIPKIRTIAQVLNYSKKVKV